MEKSLPLFYDKDYKGFANGLPPIGEKYYHTIYMFTPSMLVADLARMGNADARRMILGFRDRLVEMGPKCDYWFANIWTTDYARQNFLYQFDNTCAYIYLMMSLYDLSDGKDMQCLDNAKVRWKPIIVR
jgi:hypothetical protein